MIFIYEFFNNLVVAWEFYTSIKYLEYIPEFDGIRRNMCGYETGIICGYKANHSKKFVREWLL